MIKTSLVTAFLVIMALSPVYAGQDGDEGKGGGGEQQGRADHDGAGRNWQEGRGDYDQGNWQGGKPNRNWQEGRGDHDHGNWQRGKPNRNWQEGRGDHDEGDWEGGDHRHGHRGYYGWYGSPYGYYRRPYPYSYSYGGYGGCGWLYANAMATGDPYLWEQYYACVGY
jgi:hypothetical protein